MTGFVKVKREILDDPTIFRDPDYVTVWLYLMLNAVFAPVEVSFHGQRITLQPGQLTTGRKKIAEKCRVQESKVQRILKRFEVEHLIEQRTDRQCRLITICSWSDEQKSDQRNEQQMNNDCTTSEQRVNTKKEGKEDKNLSLSNKRAFGAFRNVLLTDREYQKLQADYPDDIERAIEILDLYVEETGRAYKSHAAAMRKWAIEAARKEKESRGRNTDTRTGNKERSRMAGTARRDDGKAQNFADLNIPMAQDFFSS